MTSRSDPFLQHIEQCRSACPPGKRLPFLVQGCQVGWMDPDCLALSLAHGAVRRGAAVDVPEPSSLQEMAGALAEAGHCRWRAEAFDVRACADHAVLGVMDRGALPNFGIEAWGVHVNGLVHRADGLHLWVAQRGEDRPLDPGKLDHITAGGIPAGLDAAATLVKEAGEEARIPPSLATQARFVAEIPYCLERPEGLRRDRLFCYDLELPEEFRPSPGDAEAAGFDLWPLGQVFETVRDTERFKFNVNLVLIDLFIRQGLLDAAPYSRMYQEPRSGR